MRRGCDTSRPTKVEAVRWDLFCSHTSGVLGYISAIISAAGGQVQKVFPPPLKLCWDLATILHIFLKTCKKVKLQRTYHIIAE